MSYSVSQCIQKTNKHTMLTEKQPYKHGQTYSFAINNSFAHLFIYSTDACLTKVLCFVKSSATLIKLRNVQGFKNPGSGFQ